MTIKPIETKYKGYKFRSRLEARWAVYFDAIGMEWEYEPEGFVFDGITYLPDFRLEDLGIWCEIKRKLEHTTQWSDLLEGVIHIYPELEKAERFRDYSNAIAVVVGSPGKERIYFYGFDLCEDSGGLYDDYDSEWIIAEDGEPALNVNPRRDDRVIFSNLSFEEELPRLTMNKHRRSDYIINNAINRARSARFEHGKGYV